MADGYWSRASARVKLLRVGRRKHKPKGMEEQLASYADYLFEAPDHKVSMAIAIVLSIIVGAVAFPYGLVANVEAGLLLFALPALLAGWITKPLSGVFGENVTYNRSALIALIMVIVVIGVSFATSLVTYLAHIPYTFLGFVLALSLIFALRMLVLMGISVNSLPKVLPPASLQTVFSAVFLLYYVRNPVPYLDLAISSVIFVTASFAFVRYVDYPMVKSFGVSSLDFIQEFIAHLTEGSPAMEEFFEKIGGSVDVPVNVLSFKRPDDSTPAPWARSAAATCRPSSRTPSTRA